MSGSKGIRAGAAYVEAWLEDSRLRRGLVAAQKRLRAFGATVAQIGAGLSAAGAAVAGPMLAAVQRFADQGDQLEKMAARTGATVEALSELNYAAGQSGAGASELEAGLRGMARTLLNAARDSAMAVDSLDDLGLTVKDLEGLAPEEQFTLLADRVAQVEDPTRRAALAMQVFGRAGQRLLPMIADGAEGIAALRQEARDLGQTVKTEDAKAAAAFGDQLDRLWKVIGKGVFLIGAALAPALTEAIGRVLKFLTSVVAWIDANRTLVLTIFKVALGVVATGTAITLLGGGIIGLGAVLGGAATVLGTVGTLVGAIGSALAFLVSPIGLVITALGALATWFLTSTETGAAAIDWLAQKFAELQTFTMSVFSGIADALAAGNLALAARILWLALQVVFQKGIATLKQQWLEWKTFFLSVFNEAVYGLASTLTSAWAGLQKVWVIGTSFLLDAWDTVTTGIINGWRNAQNFVGQGFLKLLSLFDEDLAREASQILDEDVRRQNAASAASRNAAIAGREQAKSDQLGAIEGELAARQAALENARHSEQDALFREQAAGLSKAEEQLRAAQAELAAATAEANRERQTAGLADTGPALSERLQKLLDGSALTPATKALSSQGTFSALAAVRSFGATSAADRTAKATEDTAKNTKALVKQGRQVPQFT